jgi:hypothetical protein
MVDLATAISDDSAVSDTEQAVNSEPAAEPSRIDVIREAVAAQKDRADPDATTRTPPSAGERARAPDGKFMPGVDRPAPDRTASAAPAAAAATAAAPAAPVAGAPVGDAVGAVRPPPGWSPASKVLFDALPPAVKADIARRETEINAGFARLAAYKDVDKYVDMAAKGGTTLPKALEAYVGMESELRRDVFSGVDKILANIGIKNPVAFAQAYLQRVSGRPQTQAQQPSNPAPQSADPRQIAAQVRAEIKAEQEQTEMGSALTAFENDPKNQFYANVKPAMVRLIQSGLAVGDTTKAQLQDAYDKACRLDPAIVALVNKPAPVNPRLAVATQARAASRATIGALSEGTTPQAKAPPANQSRRAVIEAAVAAQKGARA